MSIFDLPEGKKPDEPNVSERLSAIVDKAMMDADVSKPRRKYLGASRWGHHCDRALGYEFHGADKDEGRGFKGRTLRIFDMGHDGEERMAEYLRKAGFEMVTHDQDGRQIGFSLEDGMLKGHVDGIITAGPDLGMAWPALWENKALGDSTFAKAVRLGIKEANRTYYVQAQVYMTYNNLRWCLFTCLNRDTGEIHAEILTSDSAVALSARDRAIRIVHSSGPDELPRCTTDMNDRRCKMCDYANRCWSAEKAKAAQPPAADDWIAKGWRKPDMTDKF